jgi:hypothetical protein
VPGNFYTADDLEGLIKKLSKSLRQRLRYSIEDQGGNRLPNIPEDGLDVSRIPGSHEWFPIPVDNYRVWVQTNRRIEQRVSVEKGQLLLIDVEKDGSQLRFRRSIFGNDYVGKTQSPPKDNWQLTVLQNQIKVNGALQMMTVLEKLTDRDPERGTLKQVRPLFTWFDLESPEAAQTPFGLRWGYLHGVPAPAWTLDVRRWPTRIGADEPAKPVLKAWFSPGDEPAAVAVRERGSHFTRSPLELKDHLITVDNKDEVLIEGIAVEERQVVSGPNNEPEKVPCLVVRASYPKGRPAYVQVDFPASGQEHHFHTRAYKYTGIFWPVNQSQADGIRSLKVFLLDRFQTAGTTSTIDLPLPPPRPSDDRPFTPPPRLFQRSP